ncbi:MAG: SdrD B-like domain-containing protein [Vicinamibacterales bacterium]
MSQVSTSQELQAQSEELLRGPLKHARTAALALALVPLAAVAVTTQTQEDSGCPSSAGICGTIFYDTNGNGIQESGESGISNAVVTITYTLPGGGTSEPLVLPTNDEGFYATGDTPSGTTYTVSVQIPPDTTPSLANNPATDDQHDSDGVPDGDGNSVAHVTLVAFDPNGDSTTDFGFTASGFSNPGTGTPGYWKNHPEAWPVSSVTVGGKVYTKDEALAILNSSVSKDKTYTMFSSLVPAMLNVTIGNDSTCVSQAIADANAWMAAYGPVGSGVAASSYAWKLGEPIHRQLDNYNNGMLCAPHRE